MERCTAAVHAPGLGYPLFGIDGDAPQGMVRGAMFVTVCELQLYCVRCGPSNRI